MATPSSWGLRPMGVPEWHFLPVIWSLALELTENLLGRPFSREGLGGQSQGVSLSISFMVAAPTIASVFKASKAYHVCLANEEGKSVFRSDSNKFSFRSHWLELSIENRIDMTDFGSIIVYHLAADM